MTILTDNFTGHCSWIHIGQLLYEENFDVPSGETYYIQYIIFSRFVSAVAWCERALTCIEAGLARFYFLVPCVVVRSSEHDVVRQYSHLSARYNLLTVKRLNDNNNNDHRIFFQYELSYNCMESAD